MQAPANTLLADDIRLPAESCRELQSEHLFPVLVFQDQIFQSNRCRAAVNLHRAKNVLLLFSRSAASHAQRRSPCRGSTVLAISTPALLQRAYRHLPFRFFLCPPARGVKRSVPVCYGEKAIGVDPPCDDGYLFASFKGRTGQGEDSLHLQSKSSQLHYRHDEGRMLTDSYHSKHYGGALCPEFGAFFEAGSFGRGKANSLRFSAGCPRGGPPQLLGYTGSLLVRGS